MNIKYVKITDFLSIKELTYDFDNGLYLFTGTNGVGKTSILQALQVGLFNKCERPQPWARLAGDGGFIIEVGFIDNDGKNIIAINNRKRNRYEVYEDDELLTHQISKGLPIVSQKLNLTYDEFTMLSYLTPNTVASILTGTDSSLISKFFSLHVLTTYDKALREERTGLNRDKKQIESRIVDAMEVCETYDIKELQKEFDRLTVSKAELLTSNTAVEIKLLSALIEEKSREKITLLSKVDVLKDKLEDLSKDDGVCPTCGTKLNTSATHRLRAMEETKDSISSLEVELKGIAEVISFNEHVKAGAEKEFKSKLEGIEGNLRKTESELMAAKLINERESEDIDKLTSELSNIESKVFALTSAIEAIKSGEVHKAYLHTFTSVLNGNLGKLKQDLNIPMRVLSKIDNNGLSFSVLDDGVYKFSDVLSAGEKVIVGLMVLTAMFETLSDTLDININIVMLDEAVAAVSQQNMRIIESLLKNLAEGRSVIVTQHHDELPEEMFKEIKHISKVDGITQID